MNLPATGNAVQQTLKGLMAEVAVRRAGLVFLAAIIPFVVMWPTSVSLAKAWGDPMQVELSHGYLTALIVIWLIWARRNEYAQLQAQPNRLALPALAVLSVAWLVMQRTGIQVGHQMLLPLISVTTVCAVLGWPIAKRALFPLGYLYMAMPIWTVLIEPLQWGSVLVVRAMLRLSGIPVYFSGTKFEIPEGVFEIAGGCSGLRLMLVGLAIGALYGELQKATLAWRVALVALAALLSAFANWLRIYLIIGGGHLYGLDNPLVKSHVWFGWLVFACAMIAYFWIANRWIPLQPMASATNQNASTSVRSAVTWQFDLRWLSAAVLMLVLGPMWSVLQVALGRFAPAKPFVAPSVAAWHQESVDNDWQPVFIGADWQVQLTYLPNESSAAITNGQLPSKLPSRIELYTAVYKDQRHGKELLWFENSIFGKDEYASNRVLARRIETLHGVPVMTTIMQSHEGAWMYWHSYAVGNAWLVNPLHTQLRYAVTSLGKIPETRVLVLRTPCADSTCAAAASRLEPLWQAATLTQSNDALQSANL